MPNRLANETSPYLRQHADNPVDWYPWGPEALARAKELDRPILLSIGYSACHWCHVMERESFEDEGIAARMNASFVNVKVDREERPDLDEIYMKAVQAFQNGRGGWPMTVFLSPEGEPFFAGSYYPPVSRQGMPGFTELLERMASLWADGRPQVDDLRRRVREMLEQTTRLAPPGPAAGTRWMEPVVESLQDHWDAHHGGLKGVPKFPPHGGLAVLLAQGVAADDDACLDAALTTLDAMAQGGIYDLLAGGFARYSVDAHWRVPHFEKMLYDNAQLLPLYVEAWRVTGAERFERVIRETVGWAIREMQLDEGGFAASQDADTEGEEGRCFVWTPAELAEAVGADDGDRLTRLLGVTPDGTFGEGRSVLRLDRPLHQLDRRERALWDRCRPRLFRARNRRTRPGRDDKVVTAWNGLMIRALAIAGFALDEAEWVVAATRCAQFLLESLVVDGRLQRTWKDGRAHLPGYADDHAALALGLVELYGATFERRWLDEAVRQLDALEALFADPEGGLYTTGSDQPPLVVRAMQSIGGAEPSANGLAALALARLAILLDRPDLGERADRILARLQPILADTPAALGLEALAGAWRTHGRHTLALVGDAEAARPLLSVLRREPCPFVAVAGGADPASIGLGWVEGKEAPPGVALAFLCEGDRCQLPTADPEELSRQLDASRVLAPGRPIPPPLRRAAPPLPTHAVRWLHTNKPPRPEDLLGQVVLLHFFAPSSLDCRPVHDALLGLARTMEGRPVVVLGVASPRFPGEGDRRAVARAIGRLGLLHPVLVDEDLELFEAFEARGRPTVVVLDTQGRVAWQRTGPCRPAALVPLVEGLLAEASVTAEPLPPPEFTEIPDGPLRFPSRLHVFPDAMMQELGADALDGGSVYVADAGHHRIVELRVQTGPDGWPTYTWVRAFGSGAPGFRDGVTDAAFRDPHGMVRVGDELFVADLGNCALRAVHLVTGEVRTLAGTGRPRARRLRGRTHWDRPLDVALAWPIDVEAMEIKGRTLLYLAMAGCNQVWAYGMGMLACFAGSGRLDHVDGPAGDAALAQPSGLALFGRYLLFTDALTSSVRGLDLQHHHAVTVVGLGLDDHGDVDGAGDKARMQFPTDLTFAGDSLFVADTLNHKIKRVSLSTLETRTVLGGDPDVLQHPSGVERLGRFLLVADTDNHRLRTIDPVTREARDVTW